MNKVEELVKKAPSGRYWRWL